MSLTGWPVLGLLFVGVVALPSAALIGWSRLRPRVTALVVCAALLLGGQLCAVGLAAAAVNRSGRYYTSWSQVWGTFSKPPGIRRDPRSTGSTTRRTGSLSERVDRSFSTPPQWAGKGEVESVTVTGASSGLTSHAFVFLPPQYFRSAYRHTRFAVSEVFTGYPGNTRNLLNALYYPGVLRSEVSKSRARPMVLVMLRPSVSYPRDTECSNVPGGPQALTFFAQDVTSAIDRHFRVQPTGWGSIGDSTGGYCSAKLAMTYPATFRAAVSLSGYYRALQDHTTGDLWGGSSVVRHLNDLRWRLKHQPAPAISLLVTISKEERGPLGYADTRQFLRLAKPPLRLDSIILPHGAHNFRTWSAVLPQSLDWLSHNLPAPDVPR